MRESSIRPDGGEGLAKREGVFTSLGLASLADVLGRLRKCKKYESPE